MDYGDIRGCSEATSLFANVFHCSKVNTSFCCSSRKIGRGRPVFSAASGERSKSSLTCGEKHIIRPAPYFRSFIAFIVAIWIHFGFVAELVAKPIVALRLKIVEAQRQ